MCSPTAAVSAGVAKHKQASVPKGASQRTAASPTIVIGAENRASNNNYNAVIQQQNESGIIPSRFGTNGSLNIINNLSETWTLPMVTAERTWV